MFIIWPFKCGFIALKVYLNENLLCRHGCRHGVICSRQKYVTVVITLFMTRRYPLNNSNVI